MAKLSLQDVLSWFNSGPTIAANNRAIEAAIENTISRDGTSPNDMEADLDLGGHRIINLAAPIEPGDAVRLQDISEGVTVIQTVPWDEVTDKPTNITQIAELADPNDDRILFWDDSAGAYTHLTVGDNLNISGTTLTASGGGGSAIIPNKQWLTAAGAAVTTFGATTPVVVGTGSSPAKSTGSLLRGYWSRRRQASATTANSVGSFRSGNNDDECYFAVGGSASPQAAGFYFRIRFSPAAISATQRFFCGMALPAAETGTVDPSSLLNCLGVGKDGSDTNLFFMHNDGSGAATKVDLGFAFNDHSFELILNVPVGGGSCTYTLTDLDTDTIYQGTVNTNVPAADTALYWRLWCSSGAVAGTAVAVDFHQAELRYPL